MNLNTLTEKAQESVLGAQTLATEQNHSEVTPEHLLVVLVEQSGGIVPSILRKMSIDPARMAADARALLKTVPQAQLETLARLKAHIAAQEIRLASMRSYMTESNP